MPRELRVFVLGTGSSGNAVVVEAAGERLLLDAGIGPVRATERMRGLGAEFVTPRAPLGIFVTHEHGDHAAQALPLARALRAPLFAHARIEMRRARSRVEVRSYVPGRPVSLGPFVIEALEVPHDAPHVALRVTAGGRRVGFATDLGHATRPLHKFLAACDLVLLEANYCPRLLEAGPYPPHLRGRVAGPLGHLANEQAAGVARALENTRVARLLLIHLSRANNTPTRAMDVVASRAHRLAVDVVPHGVARIDDVVPGHWSLGAEQLTLLAV